ncbi:hypothetical protein ACJX0J_040226, partial [Zea mays]
MTRTNVKIYKILEIGGQTSKFWILDDADQIFLGENVNVLYLLGKHIFVIFHCTPANDCDVWVFHINDVKYDIFGSDAHSQRVCLLLFAACLRVPYEILLWNVVFWTLLYTFSLSSSSKIASELIDRRTWGFTAHQH